MSLGMRVEEDEFLFFKDLMKNKPDGTRMVEWGSGGSTLFFLRHFNTGYFTSIEHNPEWFEKVMKAVQAGGFDFEVIKNFTYIHAEPEYGGKTVPLDFYGYGVPMEENPCFARRYINPETPDNPIFDADIYFVDGICRGAVLATILAKAQKRDAQIYIHDYYGDENREEWYNWASCLFSKTEKVGTTLARLWI